MPVKREAVVMPARDQIANLAYDRLSLAVLQLFELTRLGTAGYQPMVARRLMILNMMAYLIAVFSAIYAIMFAVYDYAIYHQMVHVNLLLAVVALAIPLVHRYDETAAGYIIAAAEYFALFLFVRTLGRESGIQLNFVVGAAAPFVILGLKRIRMVVAIIAIGLALHLTAWFLYPNGVETIPADPVLLANLYVNSAITSFAVIAMIVFYAFRLADRAEAETDALLKNVLPASIAERLKGAPGRTISDSVAEASVLFVDLVGFTPLAKRLGAARIVDLLNAWVTELDRLAAANGVEKIKTIGDSFMAVCGAPERRPDHAVRMACMALEVRDAVQRFNAAHGLDLAVRIGIAAGPVMAGVIGTERFTYDVWGDTVNLAARLEQTGEAGKIQVCGCFRAALAGLLAFDLRGTVDIKGLGPQETWFLTGLADKASAT
ncbi:MAG: adenylate/guanylate cyclase domain-containing protein [Hyphomicrobiaceae bacterium]